MKYWFFLIFATVSWGLNFHLAKIMLQDSSAMEAGLWRYIFGVGVLLTFLWHDWPKWSQIRSQAWPILLIGLIGLFGFNFCFFIGISKTSAINAALIAGLNPATTLLFSRFLLKIPISKAQLAGILLALAGVIFLILKGQLGQIFQLRLNEGDLWMLVANGLFALHHVWVKQYGGVLSNRHFTFLTNLTCLAGFVLLIPFLKIGDIGSYPLIYWLSAIGMGVVGTALAYYYWNKGLARIGAPQAAIFMNMVPFSAALFALLFGEPIHLYHLVSGLVIIGGVVIMQMKGKKAKQPALTAIPSDQNQLQPPHTSDSMDNRRG